MHKTTVTALTAALLGSVALIPETAFAGKLPTCAQLAALLARNPDITKSSTDNQGVASPQAAIIPATATAAAYCNVLFQFSSESGSGYGYAPGESQTIGIIVGLPLNSTDRGVPTAPDGFSWRAVNGAWNGKVENIGGGGNVGNFFPAQTVTSATNTGYVGSFTDGGHNLAQSGAIGDFAIIQATQQLDLGKIRDFTFESIHQQYVWAGWLAEQYYGQRPTRNYWNGCSTGGREGLALAEKFGGDFDGILAGAPAAFNTEFVLAMGWAQLVNRDDVVGVGDTALTADQFNFVNSQAVSACGVDGVIDDPRQCSYTATPDRTVLLPPEGTCTGTNCVDSVQAAAIDKIWDGPRNRHNLRLWHPWRKGAPVTGFFSVGPDVPGGIGAQMGLAWAEKNLEVDTQSLYSTDALAKANPRGVANPIGFEEAIFDADRPGGMDNFMGILDLQSIIPTAAAGPKHPKIIMWHGGADSRIMTGDSIDSYRRIATAYGHGKADFTGLSSWFRYYHAPGVGHCGNAGAPTIGPDPTTILPDGQQQIFDDLVKWTEDDVVPQSAGDSTHVGILGTGVGNFGTRPICPWPTTAIYTGHGPTTVASSYICGGNLEANVSTVCFGLHTVFGEEHSDHLDWKEQGAPQLCQGISK